ncbi:hypothetical protein [Corynebacterium glutamicum]|uniref:hypothetical protein n=1 Tax=Corynebacterium glutamicum TaxID=1718 RepID=UPI000744C20A|nr:hypothetical protein [Corynebacterium glutamicum]AMA00229.1 hypothetical protein APT58_08320 [Corynebacterium glutamicum]
MTSLRKKIATAFIATALIVPTATGIASAQSSFVSGSSSSAETPGTNHGSKANQLERAVEQSLSATGQIKSPVAEASANELLQRALNYEVAYIDDFHENVVFSPASYSLVLRIPVTDIDTVLGNVPEEFENAPAEISAPFGVAVGKDADYYYVSVVLLIG